MAKCFIISVGVIVFLIVNIAIKGGSTQYVSENDLMADPTMCKAGRMDIRFKLEDIACRPNGISELTVYGHTDINWLFIALENASKFYSIEIKDYEAEITSHSNEKLNVARYHENPLNLTEFLRIDIHLEYGMGDELRIKVFLPNGNEIHAVDPTPISIQTVWLYFGDIWYYKCPKYGCTESAIIDSTTSAEESSTDTMPEKFENSEQERESSEVNRNEANSIVGHFSIESKAKISNFLGIFNLTLS